MGKIFCILGKSSVGKDTVYKKLLEEHPSQFRRIIPYTTRPIRAGEQNGVEYFFTSDEELARLQAAGKVIECRAYDTFYGVWNYFTVKDEQINLDESDYLIIGTLESYVAMRQYFGKGLVVPIYIAIDDGERLQRALNRERQQQEPKYEEMCRRFLADQEDFSEEQLLAAGIDKIYDNQVLEDCIAEIVKDIQ